MYPYPLNDRAQPQLRVEEEAAKERASSAREIAHLRSTIERMQATGQQRTEEGNAVVQGLEQTLQELYEQVRHGMSQKTHIFNQYQN